MLLSADEKKTMEALSHDLISEYQRHLTSLLTTQQSLRLKQRQNLLNRKQYRDAGIQNDESDDKDLKNSQLDDLQNLEMSYLEKLVALRLDLDPAINSTG